MTSPVAAGRTGAAPEPAGLRPLTRAVALTAVVLGAVYAVAMLPGVRPAADDALWRDAWLTVAFMTSVVALSALRAYRDRAESAAHVWLTAALTAYTVGNVVHYTFYASSDAVPVPSWADAGWLAFFPLVYVATVLGLRSRLRSMPASMWLDGLVAGLTVAALAVAFVFGAALTATQGSLPVVVTAFAYPIADLLMVGLLVGAMTVIGRNAGATWWWLSGGMAVFVVSDSVYAYQLAAGTYQEGGLVDVGWVAAFACFGAAACARPRGGTTARLEGLTAVAVPLACALVSLALLFHGFIDGGDPVAGALALCAVLAALARATLTFREVQALADSRRQALTDELTGLPNRRRVYQSLAEADAWLRGGEVVTLLLVDLDRFKEINDSLGHAAGDMLLRQIGPRLRPLLRPGDLLARLGGDEFVVLARGLDAVGAEVLAGQIRACLQESFSFGAMTLTVDASVGIAAGPDHASGAEELLQMADLAMYSAKSRRVGVAVYDEQRDGGGRHRLEVVEQLRAGMRRGELVLHYQPKLALAPGAAPAVEALVRWQHPTRGLLYPQHFVHLAESHGLMAHLTLAVLDLALRQRRAWADEGHHLDVAVNVSPSNLVDDGFPGDVAALLDRHGVPATALVLEVTESLLMEDRERAVAVLGELRAAGVGVAIDDYGTGYSSLSYLAQLPVTELKLDRAFVASMTASPRNEAIVTSTVQLAHALGLVLVAEGVEDAPTLEALRELGCDFAQGYHLSRPLPAVDVPVWFGARRLLSVTGAVL